MDTKCDTMSVYDQVFDVIVCGGGPAGFAAAVSAARAGAKTLLVERYGNVGGMASTGLPFLTYKDESGQSIFGLADEFARRAINSGYTKDDPAKDHWLAIDPEGVKILYQRMLLESGASLLLHSWVKGARRSGGNIESTQVMGKGGEKSIRGKMFIDCTGDADLAAQSKIPFRYGREDGKTMGMSLLFSVANVDAEAVLSAIKSRWPDFVQESGLKIPEQIRETTFLNEERFMPFMVNPTRPGEIIFNWVQMILDKNPLDAESLTWAEIEAREKIHLLFEKVMKPHIPGFKDAYISRIACQMGVRESRRIEGLYTLTEEDCRKEKEFPDTIAYCTYGFDLHASSRDDSKNVVIDKGFKMIRIPYRVMVPAQGPSNLLVAGRSVSADRMAMSAIRVMVPCMSMGEAAGTAGARCASSGKPVSEVDMKNLRRALGHHDSKG